MRKATWLGLGGLLILHLFLLFNLQFTAWPEMFSFPYLLNNGFRLYTDFVHVYPPLLTGVLAGFYRIFGYRLWVLQGVAWFLILVADWLIFKTIWLLTKNHKVAFIGLVFYILTQPFLEGNTLWFDTAIVVPVLAGTYWLFKKQYFWSGLCLTLAALTKQTAGLFIISGLGFVVFREKNLKKVMAFLVAPLLAGLGLTSYLLTTNSLADFVNWTLVYPSQYWTQFPGYVQLSLSKRELFTLLILGSPFLLALFKFKKRILDENNLMFVICNLLLTIVIVYPRWSFFHFQTALALLAILIGTASSVKLRNPGLLWMGYFFFLLVFVSLPMARRSWREEPRFWSSTELATAQTVKQKLNGSNSLFLLGPNSVYYVLTTTLPSKPWLDNFGWYWEIPGVAEKALASWNLNPPDYVLAEKPQTGDWFDLGTYRPTMVTNWLVENYNQKELITENLTLWQRN